MDRIRDAGRRGPALSRAVLVLAGGLGLAGAAVAAGMGPAGGGNAGSGAAGASAGSGTAGSAGSGGSAAFGAASQGAQGPGGTGAIDADGEGFRGFEADRDATPAIPGSGTRGEGVEEFFSGDHAIESHIDRSDAAAPIAPTGDTAHTFSGADADRNDRLTAEEFDDFRRRNNRAPADPGLDSTENERLFEDLDLDDDGRLTAEEATRRAGE